MRVADGNRGTSVKIYSLEGRAWKESLQEVRVENLISFRIDKWLDAILGGGKIQTKSKDQRQRAQCHSFTSTQLSYHNS